MRCLVVSRDKYFREPEDIKITTIPFNSLLTDYFQNSKKHEKIKTNMETYTQRYEMAHNRTAACVQATSYTLYVRQPYLNDINGVLYDLESYNITMSDRGGRLSCTFPRRIDINVGDIVYMIYTTTKCSKIAGRFEVESVSSTNNAITINALDTVAILNTMTVSLAIGKDVPPEMAIEYLGEQINIPIYVLEGTLLQFSSGRVLPNSHPRDIIDEYINSNTTVCQDDLGVVAIRPIGFTDYYITLEGCRGEWSLDVQFHEDYLTRSQLIDPLNLSGTRPYWDYGAEMLYGKTHATDKELKALIRKRYTVGSKDTPTAQWIDYNIDSGEYGTVDKVITTSQYAHIQASKKRLSYLLTVRNLPVCYDLCSGDIVIVCYQYGSDSPKNCLLRISEIMFADDRMTLKGNLHLTQHPIKYAPILIYTNIYTGFQNLFPIEIEVMPDIDIHRWQLANPNG